MFESYSRFLGRDRTNAFGVYIGHEICHRVPLTSATLLSREAYGRGLTNAFGVYIGHKICHRVPASNASSTLLSRPAITMSNKVLYIEQIKKRLKKSC